jgi:hypothetical protein
MHRPDYLPARLTGQQIEAITHRDSPLLLVAGPGSGKTEVITWRVAHLVRAGYARPENLLVTTFTQKAALELKDRIHMYLIRFAQGSSIVNRVLIATLLVLGLMGPVSIAPAEASALPPSPLTTPLDAGADAVQPPEGLSAEAWASIMRQVRQAEYHPTAADEPDVYQAPNRAHNWRVTFGPEGIRAISRTPSLPGEEGGGGWEWGLALTGYGYVGHVQPAAPAEIAASGHRVEYRRGALTEWYVNDERGLEQGFTLTQPPAQRTGEDLVLELALTGNLTPRLADDGQTILFTTADAETILRYSQLFVYDAAGRQLPAYFELLSPWEGPGVRLVVDDTAATYPLTIDPLVAGQVKKLTASDGVAGDRFGWSVAISGDTLVVAADNDDISKGAAYVFYRNEGGTDNWGQVKKLIASDGVSGDYFGKSVAIGGDTLVVGAYQDDDQGNNSGSVYIFGRNQDGTDQWGQVKKLTASDGVDWDQFGGSVAISGDTLVVGAFGDDTYKGAAYVFNRNQGGANNWGQVKKLTASDGLANERFGWSVAISGDTLVVGADEKDSNKGAAYVFGRDKDGTNQWGQVKKLTASDGAADDRFGLSVAIDGNTAVVGAYGNNTNRGAAYVFYQDEGGADQWGQVRKLTASDGVADDWFGMSVAISGDTIVVGAHKHDGQGNDSGSAYVFARDQVLPDYWGQLAKLVARDGAADDRFGSSVAIGGNTLVVGAYNDDASKGAAYVRSGMWGQRQKLVYSGAANDHFGYAVGISGDIAVVGAYGVNSNTGKVRLFDRNQGGPDQWGGFDTMIGGATQDLFGWSVAIGGDTAVVGASGEDAYKGAAHVFDRDQGGANTWGQVKKLTASDGVALDRFGYAVAISGDTIVVGAQADDASKGAAYVFDRDQGGANQWGQVKKLTASDGVAGDLFGWSVAISGDIVVVGAYGDDSVKGAAYVFNRNQGGANQWGQVKKLAASDGAASDRFGWSAAISGDIAVVGAYGDDANKGAAYVFGRDKDGADHWGQVKKLTATDGVAGDLFGYSVAISGDTVVVGARADDAYTGAAYIFARDWGWTDNWGQVAKLTASDGLNNDTFGRSAAISEDTAIIGADGVNSNEGAAYVYEREALPGIFLPVILKNW